MKRCLTLTDSVKRRLHMAIVLALFLPALIPSTAVAVTAR